MSQDGFSSEPVLYGKTTHLYLTNKKTNEIYCDLSESLRASQNGFKSSKVIKDNSPKRTYHARGRMETCPLTAEMETLNHGEMAATTVVLLVVVKAG